MKTIIFSLVILLSLSLTACGASKPLTDADKAAKQGMTLEQYNELKDAAARMNMTMDAHTKMMEE